MAYDTTLLNTVEAPNNLPAATEPAAELQAAWCFPRLSAAQLGVVGALCAVFFLTSLNRLNHTDLWGHLAFGRWIAQHGELPTQDIFAATPSDAPFFNLPWLAQLAGYGVHEILGPEGLVLTHAILAVLASCVVVAAVRARRISLVWGAVAAVAAYILALPIMGTIRPQLFGLVGAPLALWAAFLLRRSWTPLFWLPVAFALWANLHGSFAIGLVVLGLFAIAETWVAATRKNGHPSVSRLRVLRMWTAVATAVVASCLNPVGPAILAGVASFGGNDALADISEWRMMTPFSLSGALFFGSIAATVLLLQQSRRRPTPHELLLLVGFGVLSLTSIRMLAWWAFLWPVLISPHVASVWRRYREANDALTADIPTATRALLAMGIVFTAAVAAPPSHALVTGQQRGLGAVTSSDTPLYVSHELARRGLKGKIFAPMDWADYLMWKTDHRLQPLVYTHVHLVAPETWRDYLAIRTAEENWVALAHRHGLDYLLVDRKRSPDLAKDINSKYRRQIVYQDQKCLVLKTPPMPAA